MTKVLAVLLGLSILAAAPPAQAGARHDRCRYQGVEPGRWTEDEVTWTIRCATEHFGVDNQIALQIARRESGLSWWAENPYSHACGIFQHLPSYWPSRVATFHARHPFWRIRETDPKGGAGCYNARTNILVATDMVAHYGWGPWS